MNALIGHNGLGSRRQFMNVAAATAAYVLGARGAKAQAPQQGAVWLNFDQEALNKAYDQRFWAPNMEIVLGRYVTNSKMARERIGNPVRHKYGESPVEMLDVFSAKKPNAPVHIYIHGGAWRGGEAHEYSFLAEPFLRNGVNVVVPDFASVLQTNGDLMPLATQVLRSIAWVHKNAASFGGDPNKIYISGHSSGAHLAAVALTSPIKSGFSLPENVIKGAVLVSGLYDLKPARLSSRSAYVRFTDESEHLLSPQRHLNNLVTPISLVHGVNESPEFVRQTKDFAAEVQRSGRSLKLISAEGYNHFEILETLANPYGLAGRLAFEQLGL